MAEMIDMKLPKKTKAELKADYGVPSSLEQDQYPYGLRLHFESEQIKLMPSLKKYSVGDKVIIQAEGVVTSKEERAQQDREDRYSLGIQLEKISCAPKTKKKLEEMNPKEYRAEREGKMY